MEPELYCVSDVPQSCLPGLTLSALPWGLDTGDMIGYHGQWPSGVLGAPDTWRDIVVAVQKTSDIAILVNTKEWATNDGKPGFVLAPPISVAQFGIPYLVEVDDVTRDGFRDIVVSLLNVDGVVVIVNNGDGTFAAPVKLAFQSLEQPRSFQALTVDNLDGGGGFDIGVMARYHVSQFNDPPFAQVFRNANPTTLTFNREAYFPNPDNVFWFNHMVSSRFQSAPRLGLDMAAAGSSTLGGLFVLLRINEPDTPGWVGYDLETGAAPFETPAFAAGWIRPAPVRDLALSQGSTDIVHISWNQDSLPPAFGIQQQLSTSQALPIGLRRPWGIDIGLLNDDAYPDLAVACTDGPGANSEGGLVTFVGNGDGTFDIPGAGWEMEPNGVPNCRYVRLGDFNGDGRKDVAITCYNSGKVSVRLNALPPLPTDE